MSEIEDLRRDVVELREWREAVLDKCKASDGWDSIPWGGDKDGWGFVHFFIGHLNTRALDAEADALRLHREKCDALDRAIVAEIRLREFTGESE